MKFKRTMKEAFGPYTSDELHPMCSGPCHQGRNKCPVPHACCVHDEDTIVDKWASAIVLFMVVFCAGALVFSVLAS